MNPAECSALVDLLHDRFRKNQRRHPDCAWDLVLGKLATDSAKLTALGAMERTGGEPDVVCFDLTSSEIIFCDCSPESPLGRRSLCYDSAALLARKENKPRASAIETATALGIELLSEKQYRALQRLGEFDRKTSSWVQTPTSIRLLGGALFCDRRYGEIFVYHNGAESYYAARGFRGALRV